MALPSVPGHLMPGHVVPRTDSSSISYYANFKEKLNYKEFSVRNSNSYFNINYPLCQIFLLKIKGYSKRLETECFFHKEGYLTIFRHSPEGFTRYTSATQRRKRKTSCSYHPDRCYGGSWWINQGMVLCLTQVASQTACLMPLLVW